MYWDECGEEERKIFISLELPSYWRKQPNHQGSDKYIYCNVCIFESLLLLVEVRDQEKFIYLFYGAT